MEIDKDKLEPETIAFLERSQKIRANLRTRREETTEETGAAHEKDEDNANVQKSTTETLARIRALREKLQRDKDEENGS